MHTNYVKEIDLILQILLKHVNETPTISKAKNDWADGAGFQEAEDVTQSLVVGFFFPILLETQPDLFLIQFNFCQAVACGSHLF